MTDMCSQTLSPGLYRGPCNLELYKGLRRSWVAWRCRRAASWARCMSTRFCWTNWCTSFLLGCSGEVYSISKGKLIFSPKTRNGCVTCRFMNWSSKCHHKIRKLLGPIALKVIDSFGQHIQYCSIHSFDHDIWLWTEGCSLRFVNLKRLHETLKKFRIDVSTLVCVNAHRNAKTTNPVLN